MNAIEIKQQPQPSIQWWEDPEFIKELDKDILAIEAKKQNTYTFDEVKKNTSKNINDVTIWR